MPLFSSVEEASCSLKEGSEGRKNEGERAKVEMNNHSAKIRASRASRHSPAAAPWFQIHALTLRSHRTDVLKIYRVCCPQVCISAVGIMPFQIPIPIVPT